MTNIERIISFIRKYPEIGNSEISVDYGIEEEPNYTFTPSGARVNSYQFDIYGNATVEYEYSCVLLLTKSLLAGELGLENQVFIEDLQNWVIEQNFTENKPAFGDYPEKEFLAANAATLLSIDSQANKAIYSITFNIKYYKDYKILNGGISNV